MFNLNLSKKLINVLSTISENNGGMSSNIEEGLLKRISKTLENEKAPPETSIINIFKILTQKQNDDDNNDILECFNILFDFPFKNIDIDKYENISLKYIESEDWKIRKFASLTLLKVLYIII